MRRNVHFNRAAQHEMPLLFVGKEVETDRRPLPVRPTGNSGVNYQGIIFGR